MNAPAKKAAPKKHRRPVYLRVVRACVIDEKTGEMSQPMGMLMPSTHWDSATMRKQKLTVGSEVRAELKKPRNPAFDRLAHALGKIASEQIEKDLNGNAFPSDAHEALKVLQREAGICCEQQIFDLGTLGKVPVMVAQSLAHDSMTPGEFDDFYRGICRHLAAKYWPTMHADDIARQAQLMTGSEP